MTVRTNTGSATIQPFARGVPVTLPDAWLRLSRTGNNITAYYGTNGVDWIDSFELTEEYPSTVLVGMATASANNAAGGQIPASYRNFGNFAALPRLGISLTANGFVLAWPAGAGSFILESAPSLSPPVNWTPVAGSPVVVAGQNTVTVQPGNNVQAFYRLREE
jgi:hypothetical protein